MTKKPTVKVTTKVKPTDRNTYDSRRLRMFSFNIDFPIHVLTKALELLPEDSHMVGCDRDFTRGVSFFVVQSNEFAYTAPHKMLPETQIMVERFGEDPDEYNVSLIHGEQHGN